MRRGIATILCISMLAFIWLPVNAQSAASGPDLPPILLDPKLEILTFTAPKNLELVRAEKNLISIRWEDTAIVETKYIVERKKTSGDYAQLAVLGENATSYNDTSVQPDTTYFYRVRAGKDKLNPETLKTETSYTDYSNELKVKTPASSELTGKDPIVRFDPAGGITRPPLITGPGGIEITSPGSVPGGVGPLNPTGSEAPAGSGTQNTGAGAAVVINAPGALTAEAISGDCIELSWQDKSDNEAGFWLYRTYTGDWEEPVSLNANTIRYADETTQPNTTYYYVLYAYNESGNSTESNIVEVTTPEPVPAKAAPVPAAPEGLTAQARKSNEIVLSWQDKSGNEQGFSLYRTVTGDWGVAATLNANVTSYTDNAVQPNTTYYYVVYAYAGQAFSKESNMVEVVTPGQTAAAIDYTGASSWALEELKKAVEYGLYTDRIMNNYTQSITREEFCELVIKLYEKLKGAEAAPASPNPFRDTSNESVLKAHGAGVVNGTSANTFSPYNNITRQDICVMLYRAISGIIANVNMSIDGVPVFMDESLIGQWAIKEVKFAYKNGIMKGSDSKIMPRDNTNREQAILLVKRVYEIFAGMK